MSGVRGSAEWRWRAVAALLVTTLAFLLAAQEAYAFEIIPSRPARYFNDYAKLVKPETAHKLDDALEGTELSTSNQVIVVLFPALRTDSTMEDFCQRVAAAWSVGRPDKKNGVVLFYFARQQQFYIEVRPGLQGALPDAKCRQIIAERIIPWIKAGDFDGAIVHGVAAILAATDDVYKGNLHATWLHPRVQRTPVRFRDFLAPFFGISVIIYVILFFRWSAKTSLFDASSSIGVGSAATYSYSGRSHGYRYSGRGSSSGWGLGGLLLGAAVGSLLAGGASAASGRSFGGGGGASGSW